jgi:4-hydroxy-L-threonine phosphate dehydrogenase PdxA
MSTDRKPIVAIATGDAAGVGAEISMKAALDARVRELCRPIVVCDPDLIEKHARACGIRADIRVVPDVSEADWSTHHLHVLAYLAPEAAALDFGATSAASGRAALAFCSAAIRAALAGEVDAVVAAPHNQTSIALAGIAFDGYPSFVARQTGLDPDDVYLMLCFGDTKIVHCTLHVSVKEALALITRERVGKVIRTADRALKRLGTPAPKVAVGGLNPHAGEGGLFGREEIEIIAPAIAQAAAEGIAVSGPFGADTLFHKQGFDAFIVTLHDQGHITAKLLAPDATAAVAIGSPVLFSSVAHGSAHDIAGKGIASPKAMIEAVTRLAKGEANLAAGSAQHAVATA